MTWQVSPRRLIGSVRRTREPCEHPSGIGRTVEQFATASPRPRKRPARHSPGPWSRRQQQVQFAADELGRQAGGYASGLVLTKREACLWDVPQSWAWVCNAASLRELRSGATSLVLGPPDTEWPLVNPWEGPFCRKAARAGPPAGYWAENRPVSRSKTGRAFGS
jgi:hypothetical protein